MGLTFLEYPECLALVTFQLKEAGLSQNYLRVGTASGAQDENDYRHCGYSCIHSTQLTL